MKKRLLLGVALVVCHAITVAQTNLKIDSLESFAAPSMPAASIIGIQANEISRPTSFKALRLSIQNNFLDSNNSITVPDNYVIEVNPFMLSKRKNFDYSNYIAPSFTNNLWQNFSLSMATSNAFIVNDTLKTDAFSFGFRTVLWNGRVTSEQAEAYAKAFALDDTSRMQKLQLGAFIANTFMTESDTATVDIDKLEADLITSFGADEQKKQFVEAMIDKIKASNGTLKVSGVSAAFDAAYDDLANRDSIIANLKEIVKDIRNDRYGLHAELNGAVGLNFPTKTFQYSIVPRGGVWATVSYTPPVKQNGKVTGISGFEFLALGRYIWNNDEFIRTYSPTTNATFQLGNFFDAGARVNYKHKRFSAGGEFIYRTEQSENAQSVYKLNINMNYKLRENIILTYNFGKNYNLDGADGDLISTLSLNFGLGSFTYGDLKALIQ